ELLGEAQMAAGAAVQDGGDAVGEAAAGDAGGAGERRFEIVPAHRQHAAGVSLAVASVAQHRLVASALALGDELGPDPPDQGVEPEYGFDRHMQRRPEVVAAAGVA